MSPNLDSPVPTRMAVHVFKSLLSGECRRGNIVEGKHTVGRRRVFVQTDRGCVLGMELDRGDSVHTVKKRLQLAFNVPTDESSLSFGDLILKNDLSAIRNDSALLLTRNLMHRSSSTPCLSPTEREARPRDPSGPIELLSHASCFGRAQELVKEVVDAMKMGVEPVPVHGGLGGAYYFRNCKGESVAIVKPTDEEPFAPNNPKGFVGKSIGQPGFKRSVRVGETGSREVAAYLLDHSHFARVPPTALVKITHSIFNVNGEVNGTKPNRKNQVNKIASFQQFIPHDFDASDYGTSSFPVSAVHRIGILDVRIFNTDRHAGNLLVRKLDGVGRFCQVELIPIDHGLCLPESLDDPYFEWIHWPQASIPFSDEELEYIKNLNPFDDCSMLREELPMIREACLQVLILCTIFLKEAAACGLCLSEIGEMMSREFRAGEEEPSELEVLCIEARKLVIAEREMPSPDFSGEDEDVQFLLEGEELPELAEAMVKSPFLVDFGNACRNPFSKLAGKDGCVGLSIVSNLSVSLEKKTSLGEWNQNWKPRNGSGHWSADEQVASGSCFVKLGDMSEEEWVLFLERFRELLWSELPRRKSAAVGQRQRQRLGTSCQF